MLVEESSNEESGKKRTTIRVQVPNGSMRDLCEINKEDFARVSSELCGLRNQLATIREILRVKAREEVREQKFPMMGNSVYSKATQKGPFVIIGESAKQVGPQKNVVECFIIRDSKGRDDLMPKADATVKAPEKGLSVWLIAMGASIVSAGAALAYLFGHASVAF